MTLLSKNQMVPQWKTHPTIPFEKCLAKSEGATVLTHSVAAYLVGKSLLRVLSPLQLRLLHPDWRWCVLLHDVGKIIPLFQYCRLSATPGTPCRDGENHVEATEAILSHWGCPSDVAKMTGCHHGTLIRTDPRSALASIFGGPEWQGERDRFLQHVMSILGEKTLPWGGRPHEKLSRGVVATTRAFISLCDWVASNPENFDPSLNPAMEEIGEMAGKAVKGMDYRNLKLKPGISFCDVFPRIQFPNEMQREICNIIKKPGVYIIEAATGSGKTEGALWAGTNLNMGMYWGMPTRAASNQIHERVVRWANLAFEDGNIPRLIHGQSEHVKIPLGGELSPGGMFYNSNRRAILMPLGVGTIDQALLASVSVKYNYMRFFGLAGKVVVLDEVHTYDTYTRTILCGLIRDLKEAGCVVIILSATLTRRAKARLLNVEERCIPNNGFPMVTALVDGKISTYRFKDEFPRIYDVTYRSSDPIDEAIDAAAKGANVVWFENTVGDAIGVYNRLRSRMIALGIPLGLLHSRFIPPDRNSREKEWLDKLGPNASNRPNGCILVATQVVEQSMDIDFDIVISRIAPSDFLIQRGGRGGRHVRQRPSWLLRLQIWVIGPDPKSLSDEESVKDQLGISALIYPLFTLVRSAELWSGKTTVELPKQTRDILERTYRRTSRNDPKWMRREFEAMCRRDSKKSGDAFNAMSGHLGEIGETLEDERETLIDVEPQTRKQSVPTKQLVLCRKIEFVQGAMRLELYTGDKVDVPVVVGPGERWKHRNTARLLEGNMLKVPLLKYIESVDPTTGPLSNLVFGHPIAVVVRSGGDVEQAAGNPTGYAYTSECGAFRVL